MVSRHAIVADRLVNSASANVISIVETRVGINVTNPAAALHVAGETRASGAVRVGGVANVGGVATARSWKGRGAVPIGSVILWSGTVLDKPQGWALCDGTVVNGFRTPDLRGRFILGAGTGPGLTERAVGQTGGAEQHVLSDGELAAHAHPIASETFGTGTAGGHTHQFRGEAHRDSDQFAPLFSSNRESASGTEVSTTYRFGIPTSEAQGHRHYVDMPPQSSSGTGGRFVGGAKPLGNMPPFYVLAYLVRVQ
jgi:microcystin-dependent protein